MARTKERTAKDGTPRYTVEIRLKGYPPQTKTFKRKTDAAKWEKVTEAAILEGRHFITAEAKKHTLAELIDRYIKTTLPNYSPKEQAERTIKLKWWRSQLGAYSLDKIKSAELTEQRDILLQTRAPATTVRYMAALSHAFTIATNEWEWLHENPLKKVKKPTEPRGRVRFLDDEERARLLAECQASTSPQLYLCVILALSTGMRKAELMNLHWKDVKLNEGYLILHQTKNGQRRRVPLAGHGLALLRDYGKIRRLDTPLVFPSESNPQKPSNLKSAFEYALERAAIHDFKWHDLRHCTASYLAMNGASLAEIAEILGHKTLAMVQRYAHLSDGHVSNVVASMNAKLFGGA